MKMRIEKIYTMGYLTEFIMVGYVARMEDNRSEKTTGKISLQHHGRR